jgi:hypothetical protein
MTQMLKVAWLMFIPNFGVRNALSLNIFEFSLFPKSFCS